MIVKRIWTVNARAGAGIRRTRRRETAWFTPNLQVNEVCLAKNRVARFNLVKGIAKSPSLSATNVTGYLAIG